MILNLKKLNLNLVKMANICLSLINQFFVQKAMKCQIIEKFSSFKIWVLYIV